MATMENTEKSEDKKSMRYPVILHKSTDGYYVEIPDFQIGTQGKDYEEAVYMAKDAIRLMAIDMEDNGEELPVPFSKDRDPEEEKKDDLIVIVNVDLADYGLRNNQKKI